MTLWFVTICASALAISLLLIARRRISWPRKSGAALLQIGIWFLVWTLLQPPALLPADTETRLNSGAEEMLIPELAPAEIGALQSLPVTGDGLPRDALRDLPPVRLQPDVTAPSPGWRIQWPRQITLGDSLPLEIIPDAASDQKLRLALEDPFGNIVDRAEVSAGSDKKILLRDTPRLSGRWLYRLRVERDKPGTEDDRREPLPLLVNAADTPKVLLWLARPGFETAALSRWLRQSGVPTQVVTQLAPELIRRETFNGLEEQSGELLKPRRPFDLWILDSQLWPQLTRAERRQLAALAEKKSLLWLVGSDSPEGFIDYAHAQQMSLERSDIVQAPAPRITGGDTEVPPLLLTGYRPQQATASDRLLRGNRDSGIYWARTSGDMSLGFVLFDASYRWITAGFAAEFSRLWKSLLDTQLSHRGGREAVALQSPLPRAGRRTTLCSAAFADAAPQLSADEGIHRPLSGVRAADTGRGRCYSYWPERAGWHSLDNGAQPFSFYVFSPGDWPLWQRSISRADTQQMAAARLGPADNSAPGRVPLPLHWIALALILLLLFTWWSERKSLR